MNEHVRRPGHATEIDFDDIKKNMKKFLGLLGTDQGRARRPGLEGHEGIQEDKSAGTNTFSFPLIASHWHPPLWNFQVGESVTLCESVSAHSIDRLGWGTPTLISSQGWGLAASSTFHEDYTHWGKVWQCTLLWMKFCRKGDCDLKISLTLDGLITSKITPGI